MYKIKEEYADRRWTDTPLLFFDFETTGFMEDDDAPDSTDEQDVKDWLARNEACHVIQVAADLYQWGEVQRSVYCFVRPSDPNFYDVPEDSSKVNGIVRSMIEGPEVQTFKEVWTDLADLFASCACCVAYNGLGFDKKVLELELARITGQYKRLTVPMLDPMIWNRMNSKKKKSSSKSNKLIDAAKDRGCAHARKVVQGQERAHNAKVDIDMLREVTMLMAVSDINTYTLADTMARQAEWRAQLLASSIHEKKKRKIKAEAKKEAKNGAKQSPTQITL